MTTVWVYHSPQEGNPRWLCDAAVVPFLGEAKRSTALSATVRESSFGAFALFGHCPIILLKLKEVNGILWKNQGLDFPRLGGRVN